VTLRQGIAVVMIAGGLAGMIWFLQAGWNAYRARGGLCGAVADCPVNWTDVGIAGALAVVSIIIVLTGAWLGSRR
jgi:hypothetical protein